MKILLLLALLTVGSPAAQACNRSRVDFEALAASPSQLTPDAFAALTPEQRKSVCLTRAYIHQVVAEKGVIMKVMGYNRKYLSPSENEQIVAAGDALVERMMYGKKQ